MTKSKEVVVWQSLKRRWSDSLKRRWSDSLKRRWSKSKEAVVGDLTKGAMV